MKKLYLGLGFLLGLGLWAEGMPAIAQSASPAARPHTQRVSQRLRFNVRNVRPSRNRIGGIARGNSCDRAISANDTPLALAPMRMSLNDANQVSVEATISPRPTFFAYVPPTTATVAEFLLTNEDQSQVLANLLINLPTSGGIVSVQVPPEVVPLEVGEVYNWSLEILCDQSDRSGNTFLEGWVQRVEASPDFATRLDQTQQRDRPALYAAEGLWQDTLASQATLLQDNPTDPAVRADWASLLRSVNLERIIGQPIFIPTIE
ncbi:DUF928 domain-containing protein [Leptolyngbya sp. AN02str]